jgi:hypothetical protein
MNHFPLVALLLFGCSAIAQTDARLLQAIGQVESGGNRLAVGDHGAALGRYQLHASSWRDANTQLARERLRTISRTDWRTPSSQDVVAMAFLRDLRRRFALVGIPHPTATQLASAWNLGFTASRRRGFPATNYAIRVTALATSH